MNKLLLFIVFTTVFFSCTNDYDPVLIENLGMKERPLTIITKVLTTKSPNFMQEFTGGSVIGLTLYRKIPVTFTIVILRIKMYGQKPA